MSAEEYAAALAKADVPPAYVELLTYLFREVLDGRNAWVADGVTRALGRAPRDFADYVRHTAPDRGVDTRLRRSTPPGPMGSQP